MESGDAAVLRVGGLIKSYLTRVDIRGIVLDQADMARQKIIRFGGDIREHPRYSIDEAAAYLRIPLATLRSWVSGRPYITKSGRRRFHPLIDPADRRRNLLSFYNLAEAHVLRATTQNNIPIKNVRMAMDYLREAMPSPHPLIRHEFLTFGRDLFIKHLGQPLNATRHGQIAIGEILEEYLKRLDRDQEGMPIQLYPVETRVLAINPRIASGKPVVKGTGISASVLLDRKNAGESIPEVAEDYGLTTFEVEAAIQEFAAA